jgi:hypothetical protein
VPFIHDFPIGLIARITPPERRVGWGLASSWGSTRSVHTLARFGMGDVLDDDDD